MFKRLLSAVLGLLLLLLSAPLLSPADINNCNGVWTNKGCDSTVTGAIKEQPLRQRSPEEVELAKKKLLIQDLRTAQLKAKNEFGIDIVIKDVEERCLDAEDKEFLPYVDCRKLVSERQAKLTESVLAARELKSKEQANKIEEEKARIEKERLRVENEQKTDQAGKNTSDMQVIIVDDHGQRHDFPRASRHNFPEPTGFPSMKPQIAPEPQKEHQDQHERRHSIEERERENKGSAPKNEGHGGAAPSFAPPKNRL